jgi:HPt (histidine-containing phosphotransfer) domain-containing protein
LQEGFQDFVAKPIDLSVLERVLRRFIPERKMLFADKMESYLDSHNENSRKEPVVVMPEEEDIEMEEEPDMAQKLESSGIHMEDALEYFGGDREAYAEIASIYCKTADEKIPELQTCLEKENWQNYTVLAHAVKSTSLNIGATELSEKAKALEFAGKEGRYEEIRENHEAMIKEYRRVVEVFRDNGIGLPAETEKGES